MGRARRDGTRQARLGALLLASLLGVGACGGDGGSGNQNGNQNANENSNGNQNANANSNGNQNANSNGNTLPVRPCLTTIRLQHDTAGSVSLAGDFNGWDPAAWPFDKAGNQFEIRLTSDPAQAVGGVQLVPPGEHQYKLVIDGADWWLDPSNPLTRFDDAQQNENSLLVMEDCEAPVVALTDVAVDFPSGTIRLDVAISDGVAAAGLATVDATLNGVPLAAPELSAALDTGRVEITVSDLPLGKHTFEVAAQDNAGHWGQLRSPVWMEPEYRNWQDLVVYNIMVDRFANGDPTNDGPTGVFPLADWHGGDFAGITQKLREGYFEDLGVTALWLSTPNDNPDTAQPGDCGQSFSAYHTYWVQSARSVENHFGTADDLKELVREAHARGIRVMVDWAANHVFIDHPLYRAHEGDPLWFNYPATTDPAQLWQNKCGVLPDGWNSYALECWFTEYLPDLNHRNHALVRQLTGDALWWVREFDLDAFRIDATKHIRSTYLRYLRYQLDREIATSYTPFYLVGENFIYDYNLIGQKISDHELQGQFDFPLYGSVRWAFGDTTSHLDSLNGFVYGSFIDNQAIADLDWGAQGYVANDTLLGIFLGNHDVTRFSSYVAGQEDPGDVACQVFHSGSPPQPGDDAIYDRMGAAFGFLLTVRGLPVIYYGDEIGLAGVHDPDNRRPMVFGDPGLSAGRLRLRQTLSRLAHLRQAHAALRTGRYDAFWGDASCLAYAKADAQETVLVIIAGDAGCTMDLPIKGGFGLIDGDVLVDQVPEAGGQIYSISGMTIPLALPAWSVQVLTRQ